MSSACSQPRLLPLRWSRKQKESGCWPVRLMTTCRVGHLTFNLSAFFLWGFPRPFCQRLKLWVFLQQSLYVFSIHAGPKSIDHRLNELYLLNTLWIMLALVKYHSFVSHQVSHNGLFLFLCLSNKVLFTPQIPPLKVLCILDPDLSLIWQLLKNKVVPSVNPEMFIINRT